MLSGKGENVEMVMTVEGPVKPDALGVILPHEHVMSTFGAPLARYPDYDIPAVLDVVLPYLAKIRKLGCGTLVDCTAAYFGRHPELLRSIAAQSGLKILTNTGYYAAGDDRYVPRHAFTETPDQIAARWTREWNDSIDETGVYPGFIKTAVDEGPLSGIDRKLIIAAARTHLQTGLVIQTHTGHNADAAAAMLAILDEEGVDPSAWIWVHAHQLPDAGPALAAARQGAWISFDGVSPTQDAHILKLLEAFKTGNLLHKVLLSHDGDSYCQGDFRPYEHLFTGFLPLLRENGFTTEQIHQLTVENPGRVYTVWIRPADS